MGLVVGTAPGHHHQWLDGYWVKYSVTDDGFIVWAQDGAKVWVADRGPTDRQRAERAERVLRAVYRYVDEGSDNWTERDGVLGVLLHGCKEAGIPVEVVQP